MLFHSDGILSRRRYLNRLFLVVTHKNTSPYFWITFLQTDILRNNWKVKVYVGPLTCRMVSPFLQWLVTRRRARHWETRKDWSMFPHNTDRFLREMLERWSMLYHLWTHIGLLTSKKTPVLVGQQLSRRSSAKQAGLSTQRGGGLQQSSWTVRERISWVYWNIWNQNRTIQILNTYHWL